MNNNLILKKFQKYSKNTNIKFINYKIKVIGPLGVLEKILINNKNKNLYYLIYLSNVQSLNNLVISNKNLKIFFDILNKLIIGVNYG